MIVPGTGHGGAARWLVALAVGLCALVWPEAALAALVALAAWQAWHAPARVGRGRDAAALTGR